MVQVVNSEPTKLFSFVRAKDGDAVMVLQNYSAAPLTATLAAVPYPGQWREESGLVGSFKKEDSVESIENGQSFEKGTFDKTQSFDKGTSVTLAPWSSRLFTRRI